MMNTSEYVMDVFAFYDLMWAVVILLLMLILLLTIIVSNYFHFINVSLCIFTIIKYYHAQLMTTMFFVEQDGSFLHQ